MHSLILIYLGGGLANTLRTFSHLHRERNTLAAEASRMSKEVGSSESDLFRPWMIAVGFLLLLFKSLVFWPLDAMIDSDSSRRLP